MKHPIVICLIVSDADFGQGGRVDGAHQLVREEILLQLQDGSVAVGKAKGMAGEVSLLRLSTIPCPTLSVFIPSTLS